MDCLLPKKWKRRDWPRSERSFKESRVESGLLVIDKPAGWTSRDCINRLERLARDVKFGHAGTLDPLATGVLLVAVGTATRIVEYLHELPKNYSAEFELGKSSPSLDVDSDVSVLDNPPVPTLEAIVRESAKWIGDVQQKPPLFSAIKVNGKRAYDLARKGKEFELAARTVHIAHIEITAYSYPHLCLELDCGSGTYVRSLGRDIAEALGTQAVMTSLVRSAIGPFRVGDAVRMENFVDRSAVSACLQSPVRAFDHWVRLYLSPEQWSYVEHGRPLPLEGLKLTCPSIHYSHLAVTGAMKVAAIAPDGRLGAIMESSPEGLLRAKRVFLELPA